MSAPITCVKTLLRNGNKALTRCGCWKRAFSLSAVAEIQLQRVTFAKREHGRKVKTRKVETVKEAWQSFKKFETEKKYPKNWAEFLKRVPEDDVWLRKYYPATTFSTSLVVRMHKEFAQPEVLDNLEGMLHVSLDLDMTSKKKTKFVGKFRETVVLPHTFDDGTSNRVLVFAKTPEDQLLAEQLGAVYTGGPELVKALEKGDVRHDDFGFIVCHMDMITEVAKIRKLLKDNFPIANRGNLGADIEEMVKRFVNGKTYDCFKPSESTGKIELIIGRMNMPTHHIVDNFEAFLNSICKHRLASLGPFVQKAVVTAPPSGEKWSLNSKSLIPPSQRNQQQEEEEDSDDDD